MDMPLRGGGEVKAIKEKKLFLKLFFIHFVAAFKNKNYLTLDFISDGHSARGGAGKALMAWPLVEELMA